MDATRTLDAQRTARSARMEQRTKEAQARLAARSFDAFMREHNAQQETR